MRAWLYVLVVLMAATLNDQNVVQAAVDADDAKNVIDPEAMAKFEKTLFAQLGLSKRPQIVDRSSIVIPEELMEIYKKMMEGHETSDSVALPTPGQHTKSANTIRTYAHEVSKIDDRFIHGHKFRLFFNVTNIPLSDLLKAAELSLSREALEADRKQDHTILVYDIIRPGIRNKTEPIFLLIDTKHVRTTGSSNLKMDVQPAVDRWIRKPKENHGLLIHIASGKDNKPAEHRHVRLRRSADESDADWAKYQPFLFTYTDDKRHKERPIKEAIASRKARAASRRGVKNKNVRELCQRKPLYVDFTNVGWTDWIVAPPGYEAYYCQGECHYPHADHMNSTNHAVVQALIHTMAPRMAPKVCCVPTQLNPISMLYLDDQNKVVLKNYQDMTVVGCGCR